MFPSVRLEADLEQPSIGLPSAPPIVADFLEHLPHGRCPLRIEAYLTLLVAILFVEVAGRCGAWPIPHLASRSEPTLHVDDLLIILELRLRAENHEHELLVRVVREGLSIGADLDEFLLIKQVDDCA